MGNIVGVALLLELANLSDQISIHTDWLIGKLDHAADASQVSFGHKRPRTLAE